jgi:hypothetical protein
MVTATVARGHTVDAPTGERRPTGYDSDKHEMVSGPVYKSFGPGETVTLPLSEIQRLIALGLLVDPAAEVLPVETGDGQSPRP